MKKAVLEATNRILKGRILSYSESGRLYMDNRTTLFDLMWAADRVRSFFKKDRVKFCSIVNAKSGVCSEDCKFCAQSVYHSTGVKRYPLLKEHEIFKAAKAAYRNKAGCFGIVTSGKGVEGAREIETICKAIKRVKKEFPGLDCSVSLGVLKKDFLLALRRAGADKFHHNLETSEGYFPKICTTHTYKERRETIETAKKAGFKVCSGALFGLGEGRRDRLKLAFLLRDMEIESVPLNFLHPVKGTALEGATPLTPQEILRTVAIFRLILPKRDIKVCGGRAVNLRSLQGMIFFAGANGMMVGNYLTQPGQDPAADLQMIQDLGLRVT